MNGLERHSVIDRSIIKRPLVLRINLLESSVHLTNHSYSYSRDSWHFGYISYELFNFAIVNTLFSE